MTGHIPRSEAQRVHIEQFMRVWQTCRAKEGQLAERNHLGELRPLRHARQAWRRLHATVQEPRSDIYIAGEESEAVIEYQVWCESQNMFARQGGWIVESCSSVDVYCSEPSTRRRGLRDWFLGCRLAEYWLRLRARLQYACIADRRGDISDIF